MKNDETTIDEALAKYLKIADTFERAAAAYDAETKAGNIAFESFCRLAALGDELAECAAALQRRLDGASKTVNDL